MKTFSTYLKTVGLTIITLSISTIFAQKTATNAPFNMLLNDYYEEGLVLNPLAATASGDNRFNNIFPNNISVPYLKKVHDYNTKYNQLLAAVKRAALSPSDKISFDIINFQISKALEREQYHLEYLPFYQVNSVPNDFAALGSGTGNQPFKTVKDYENWLQRVNGFASWVDTAIANFNKGITIGKVLPKVLVVKMIPQLEAHINADTAVNIFYGPIKNMPASFSDEDKTVFRLSYSKAILTTIIPAYKKLADYLKNVYLPKARTSTGYNALPNGVAIYKYMVGFFTTTNKTPEEIYNTGLSEVTRITNEINLLKNKLGFTGSTDSLFRFIKTGKQFFPFTTEAQVLDSFRAILPRMQPRLNILFNIIPKSKLEIRAIEKFRAASSAPNYGRGTPDGSRPGYFNARVLDAPTFNAPGMESLFCHEAIPGHHFQLSLQQENVALPKFRQFASYPVFSEGWALYAESLGEELGLYTNPYEKISALSSEIFRAARLVVDVSLHTGKMNREQAIDYMIKTAGLEIKGATSEVERYMANPGQALAYKTGELKIKELKAKYRQSLGNAFNIKRFHDAVLLGGSMPLSIFENYMEDWAKGQMQ